GASTVPGSDRTLTFGGDPSITIPPGALVVSDPVELEVPDGGDLAVSIFVPGNTGPATWHFEGRQTSFISPPGDFTASEAMPVSSTTLARFWVAGSGSVGVQANRCDRRDRRVNRGWFAVDCGRQHSMA